jgi:hypothetical protein
VSNQSKGPGEFLRNVKETTEQYIQELRGDNTRLKQQNLVLNTEKQRLEDRLKQEESGRTELLEKLSGIEEENRALGDRYLEVEQQTTRLSLLYVASNQLHETLDRDQLLASIREIINNLVGSEELAIFELDRERRVLSLLTSMGLDPERLRTIPLGKGLIGHAVATSTIFLSKTDDRQVRPLDYEADLTACIPLRLGGESVGAIAIFGLLPQKLGLEPADDALFAMLAHQAALAMYCSSLHQASGRGRSREPRG